MSKIVGTFEGYVADPYPCWCRIKDSWGNNIKFNHKDIADLEHLISQMKKEVRMLLPESDHNEI